MEEVDLQDHLATGRPRARVLQVAQLPGAARIGRGSLHAAAQHESLFRRRWRLMWADELLWEGVADEGGGRQNVTLIQNIYEGRGDEDPLTR